MKRVGGGLLLTALALAATLIGHGAVLMLHQPHVDPPPPRLVDLCARPLADRPSSCDASSGDATLLFAGDTAEIDPGLSQILDEGEGIDWPYRATGDLVRAADLAVANLETAISDEDTPATRWRDTPSHRAPSPSAGALARAGFDVAGLANNHAMDEGRHGLEDTLRFLEGAGILPLGAGVDEASARRGLVVSLGRVRVGLVAYCERQLGFDLWLRIFARGDRAGVAALDETTAKQDVARLRASGADVVIVVTHWGRNDQPPTRGELDAAHALAASGADLVVGAHAHTPQGIWLIGGIPVALGIGNYAFGTRGSGALDGGVLLRAQVTDRRLARLELVPIDVQNRRVRFQPQLLHGEAARAVLVKVIDESRALGTALALDGDLATLALPSHNGGR